MRKPLFLMSKIFLFLVLVTLISSCIKNDNFIKGDAKIRFFQAASTDTTQNFFLNGIQSGAATAYGTSTNYIVVAGDSSYKITSRNINNTADAAILTTDKLTIGQNYSVFYTKTSSTAPPSLKIFTDDVKIDLDSAKLVFVNMGYTLGSKVVVNDDGKSFNTFSIGYGERVTHKVKVSKLTKISFALSGTPPTNPPPVVSVLDSTGLSTTNPPAIAISRGRVYTVLIDGSKVGDLQMRLVTSN